MLKKELNAKLNMGFKVYRACFFFPVAKRLLPYVYNSEYVPNKEKIPLKLWMIINNNIARISINIDREGVQRL